MAEAGWPQLAQRVLSVGEDSASKCTRKHSVYDALK